MAIINLARNGKFVVRLYTKSIVVGDTFQAQYTGNRWIKPLPLGLNGEWVNVYQYMLLLTEEMARRLGIARRIVYSVASNIDGPFFEDMLQTNSLQTDRLHTFAVQKRASRRSSWFVPTIDGYRATLFGKCKC